jgi:uncharacterized protein with GYD domain
MVQAFVYIEAEPGRVQDLVQELAGMQLAASVIKQVYATIGQINLVALVEAPDTTSLGD